MSNPLPVGNEFQVNTYTTNRQFNPTIAMDADGDFVVSWTSYGQDGSEFGIYAQRYNSAGVAQGSEFRVNTSTGGAQSNPTIAIDADGDFIVSWTSYGQDGSGYGIYAQRYNSAGVALGNEFQVNTYTSGGQYNSTIAIDADGDFVVSWTSYGQDGNGGYGIYAQRYNSAGVALGSEFQVNTSSGASNSAIAIDASGDFVVSWQGYGQNGSGIYAQRYNSAGVALGSEFQVNSTGNGSNSAIAMDADGDFVVSWMSYGQDGSGYGIYAQRYNSAGVALGNEFQVNTYSDGDQYNPTIAMDADGDFVISWQSYGQDGSGYGVYAKRYNSAGLAQGSELQVNTSTTNNQYTPAIGMDAGGNFAISWTSNNQDGNLSGIYAQRFSISSTNNPPNANNIEVGGAEDPTSAIAITLTGNDTDGNIASFNLVGLPANGTLYLDVAQTQVVTANTDLTAIGNSLTLYFQPNSNWNGNNSFSYTAKDNQGASSSSATVNINVTPVNDAPALTGNPANLPNGSQNTAYTITTASLLQGFTDIEGDTLSIANVQINGNTINPDASDNYIFNPPANSNGNFTVIYQVSDGTDATNASLNFTINPVNNPPALTGTPATLANGSEDTAYTITPASLLQGFTDIEGDTLSIANVQINGNTINPNASGNYIFNPPANSNGNFTVTYQVSDGTDATNASLNFTLNPVNDAPALTGTPATLPNGSQNTAYTITTASLLQGFTDIEGDTLSIANVQINGNTINPDASGNYIFNPPASSNGNFTVNYQVSDGTDATNASLGFIINPVNNPPALTGTPATLANGSEDTAYTITTASLLQGFTDVEGDTLSIANVQINGNTINPDASGNYIFNPPANSNGNFTVTYQVSDGTDATNASLDFNLNPVNDAPALTETPATLPNGSEDTAYAITPASLLQGFTDVEGNTLSLANVQINGNTINPDASGNYIFNPPANSNGNFTVNYQVSDGTDATNASLDFTLNPVNDAPTATVPSGTQEVNSNTNTQISGISVADIDVGSSAIRVSLASSNGLLSLSSIAGLTFTVGDGTSDTSTIFSGSLADVNAALNNLIYRSLTGYAGADSISLNVSDNGNTGSGGNLSDSESISLFVYNVLNGTTGNNTLTATSNPDRIFADAGNDTVNSTVANAQQNDTFDGGLGSDTLVMSGGDSNTNLVLNVIDANNQLTGITGFRVQNFEVFNFSNFNGTLNATGSAGNDNISGGLGSDRLDGGAGSNTLAGGGGNDTYVVSVTSNTITELAGNGIDTVEASVSHTLANNVENLTLTGTGAINGTGNALDNLLIGNSGNNILNGGTGADTMNGNLGNDTYVIDNAGDVVSENLNEGNDLVQSSISYTLGSNFERLTLTGSQNINGSGNDLNNTLTGNTGNNILNGGAGADTMTGGAGNDTYIVDNAGDLVNDGANQGTDTVESSINYTLRTNVENLTLTGSDNLNGTGNSLSNILIGNSGNNLLNGSTGADTMTGGLGDDTYVVDNVGDVIIENSSEGIDLVQSSIAYTLGSDVENLTLTGTGVVSATGNILDNILSGNTAANTLTGGDGNDTLLGGNGNDTILGSNGSDTLVGGSGNDILTGGDGSDNFTYNAIAERSDTITDFNANQDVLNLSVLFSSLGVTSVTSAYLRFTQSSTNTLVQVDQDGTAGSFGFVNLATLNNTTASNLAIGTNVIV